MADHALYYSDLFVMSKDNFDTSRQAAWVADSLANEPVPPPSTMPVDQHGATEALPKLVADAVPKGKRL
jgi:hypothetical protein